MNIKNFQLPSAILGFGSKFFKKKPKPFLNIKKSQLPISKHNSWCWIRKLRKPKPFLNIKIQNLKDKRNIAS
jgi:hypothetical protein